MLCCSHVRDHGLTQLVHTSSVHHPTCAAAVVIGLTLGVAAGDGFRMLLAALSLHQLFEGFAIGSAAVDSGLSAARSALMGGVFAVTTPLGILFGESTRRDTGCLA